MISTKADGMPRLPTATQTDIFVCVVFTSAEVEFSNIVGRGGGEMNSPIDDGLVRDSGVALVGSRLPVEEALAAARTHFKWMPLCAVEEWVILDAIVTEQERANVAATGCEPTFLFAHKVVHDEQHRFEPGHWVRSSMCTTFKEGYLFATRNTVYVLLGPGHRKQSSIQAIFSIF